MMPTGRHASKFASIACACTIASSLEVAAGCHDRPHVALLHNSAKRAGIAQSDFKVEISRAVGVVTRAVGLVHGRIEGCISRIDVRRVLSVLSVPASPRHYPRIGSC
jgi:hypothetical protein